MLLEPEFNREVVDTMTVGNGEIIAIVTISNEDYEDIDYVAAQAQVYGESMKPPVVLLICLSVGVLGFCGAGALNLESQTKQAPVSSKLPTSLSLRANQFTIGQDVVATLTIKNISNQSIPFRTIPSHTTITCMWKAQMEK
jgi:hypothetical protein